MEESLRISRQIGFEKIGSPFQGDYLPDVIYRLPQNPKTAPRFNYIVVTDRPDMMQYADLLTVDSFPSVKAGLKKRSKNGLGVEFLVSKARLLHGPEVAKWFAGLRDAYRFCESSCCQFILSSGSTDPSQMISARCLEAILAEIGIDTTKYWHDLGSWLDSVIARKVILS